MVSGKRKEIWETQDQVIKIENFLSNIVGELKKIPKTHKDDYIIKKIKELIGEKELLEGKYE